VDRVTEIAHKRGVNNAQIALAWMLSKPGITAPIIGACEQHHLDNALASLDIQLNAEEIKSTRRAI
jgi:aryl-alcohol dehydrogenase (NADP+)